MIRLIVLFIAVNISIETSRAACIQDSRVCAEGPETRIINGHPITRSCWRYDEAYTCEATSATEEPYCQDLRDQGCIPLSQTCDADGCLQSFQCTVGSTTIPTGQGCENQSVAVGQHTFDTGYQPNNALGQAASTMAAVEDAVTGMLLNEASCAESPPGSGTIVCASGIAIFTGENAMCRKDKLGFKNCCKGSGWGTDTGLAVCNEEEKLLGYAVQEDRTHYIGRYCRRKPTFGGCLSYAHVHCKFTSKIGRIIQQQGRAQLGIGWGSPQSPQCRGFTEQELASINFDLIDFSEYFGDAFASMNPPLTQAQMSQITQNFVNTLQSSGGSGGSNP